MYNLSVNYHPFKEVISVPDPSVTYHPSDEVISVLSVNYHPSDGLISVLSVNNHPFVKKCLSLRRTLKMSRVRFLSVSGEWSSIGRIRLGET